ncbi:uncharacterized protein LOC107041971 [Diachasma alloeum]|uniref:uncharacterized protein LOC107041971 n=1 Tax=Diachasma alloeum TaxID=454923 RepID=UPI0007381B8C|nr:uncharacterized protein LOC107041971 [Diachasma alloeum]
MAPENYMSQISMQMLPWEGNAGCNDCDTLEAQLALATRELNVHRLRYERLNEVNKDLTNENKHLRETSMSPKLDTICDAIKTMTGDVKDIKTKVNSQILGAEINPEISAIDNMTCALDKLEEHDSMPTDISEDQIYYGNGICVEKKKVKDLGGIKGLQKQLHLVVEWFWPCRVYEWALSENLTPHHIKNSYILAMQKLINSVKWLCKTQYEVSNTDIRRKITKITDMARRTQRSILSRAQKYIPRYLRTEKMNKDKSRQNTED